MRKQELIHLHGLLSEVVDYCRKTDDVAFDMTPYESSNVRPTSIHRSKTDHKEAVFALSGVLADELDGDVEEAPPATAD